MQMFGGGRQETFSRERAAVSLDPPPTPELCGRHSSLSALRSSPLLGRYPSVQENSERRGGEGWSTWFLVDILPRVCNITE